jgi:hypothetical protein
MVTMVTMVTMVPEPSPWMTGVCFTDTAVLTTVSVTIQT